MEQNTYDMASPSAESEMKLSFEEYHEFKLPSEVDPLTKEGKGGFLEGEIQLPYNVPKADLRLTISTQSTLSKALPPHKIAKYPEVGEFSPCLIYPFQKPRGHILWDKMPRPYLQHWKMELLIKGNTVYLKKNTSELLDGSNETVKQEPEWAEVSEIGSDQILHFGKDIKKNIKEGIQKDVRKVKVKILYPKSEARSTEGDVTVKKMLRSRGCPEDSIEDIAMEFSGKTNRRRLNECKLHVNLQIQEGGRWTSIRNGLSEPIKDSKCQLKMLYRAPNVSCSLGGTNVAMLSESSIDKNDVVPQFQLWSKETGAQIEEKEESRLLNNQIDEVIVRNSWLLFSTPAQPHLETILSERYEFKLVAIRASDGAVSNAFDFTFRLHDSCLHTIGDNIVACSDCHFSNESLPQIVKAIPGKRKLGMERTPGTYEEEKERDSYRRKMPKMMSPDSGMGDSPARERRESADSTSGSLQGRRESNDSIDNFLLGILTEGPSQKVEDVKKDLPDGLCDIDTSMMDPVAPEDLEEVILSLPAPGPEHDGVVPKSSPPSTNKDKPKSPRPKDPRPEARQGVLRRLWTTTKNYAVGLLVFTMLMLLRLAGENIVEGGLEVVFGKLISVFSPFPIFLAILLFLPNDWVPDFCTEQKIPTLPLHVLLAALLTVLSLRVFKRYV